MSRQSLVELLCVFRDVACEVPREVEGFGGLLFFEGCDDAPLVPEMFDDCLDGLAAVANAVVFELFDVRGVMASRTILLTVIASRASCFQYS